LFGGLGASLLRRVPPPKTDAFETTLRDLAEQTASTHAQDPAGEDASRRAALGFALEQLQRDIRDLAERTLECARQNLPAG
jgi:hypothetical protein